MNRIALGFNLTAPIEATINYAQKAEELGYESFWVHDSYFFRDAVSYLSGIALHTKQIKLGSACVNTVTRHPMLTAMTFATLDEISHQRMILGIGLGGFPWIPKLGYKLFPFNETKPKLRLKESIHIIRALLHGDNLNFKGQFYTVEDIGLQVVPKREIPIYIASWGQETLKMAVGIAEGVVISPGVNTVEWVRNMNRHVEECEEKQGRKIDHASYILCSVADKQEDAVSAMKKYPFIIYQIADVLKPEVFKPYGVSEEHLHAVREAWRKHDMAAAAAAIPDEAITAVTLTGSPDQVLDGLEYYRKAGVELPIITPIGDVPKAIQTFAPKQ
ncbi:MAG: LLM class flavin-dependent oxidoreductase [Thaumarchaeota archaeon]|nr:LLM class flavin-dependent oxidoreductase [Nitrososphaerota archaeon]